MWVVLVIQIVLSIATLVALFVTVAWLRSSAREGRETKRLLEHLSALVHEIYGTTSPGPSAVVSGGPAKARETPSPLAVKLGNEVVELDAETIARIDALKEDVNAGRADGHLLQRVIEAGLDKTEQGNRDSGEMQREPEAHEADEPMRDIPADEVMPTPNRKPKGR